MPLYEITEAGLTAQESASFTELEIYERADLQRLLRDKIDVLGEDLLVVAEEFGEWEDARRRIDLLAVDRLGHLVVIELKRTEDGGHMDLQAVRYAAMVSAMRFDEVLSAHTQHVAKHRPEEEVDSRRELLDWFAADEGGEDAVISSDVRIVLVSSDFGREITTTVLWLNRFEGMDIRCVRLVPYRLDDRVLLDIQQVVPLPEAADYQVQLRRKETRQARVRSGGRDYTRYHIVVDDQVLPAEKKRQAVRVMVHHLVERGAAAHSIGAVLGGKFRFVDGEWDGTEAVVTAFRKDDRGFDATRWFVEHAICQDGRTWVLSNHWGGDMEPTLGALARNHPEAQVTFRVAEG
ncbi:MAG TPA: hypothetical protein VK988_04630 [Acidimicrobiales bacterium]|nr:hypothetical protein [Acidimicrobiales bacterium]